VAVITAAGIWTTGWGLPQAAAQPAAARRGRMLVRMNGYETPAATETQELDRAFLPLHETEKPETY
jgi:hypothetical protein